MVVGLIGTGQEMHKGEEAGLGQWGDAIRQTADPGQWIVHGPPETCSQFAGINFASDKALTLNTTVRSHMALTLDIFVDHSVSANPKDEAKLCEIAAGLEREGSICVCAGTCGMARRT